MARYSARITLITMSAITGAVNVNSTNLDRGRLSERIALSSWFPAAAIKQQTVVINIRDQMLR